MNALLLALPGNEAMPHYLTRLLGGEAGGLELLQLPDGVTHVGIASDLGASEDM
jgi:hypothetical protein